MRAPTLQEKMQRWVKNNPDRWYTVRVIEIHAETGISEATLHRYLVLHIAREADILPSEVKAKRREGIGTHNMNRLPEEKIAKIQEMFHQGFESLSICYILKYSLATVEKYRPKPEDDEKENKQE